MGCHGPGAAEGWEPGSGDRPWVTAAGKAKACMYARCAKRQKLVASGQPAAKQPAVEAGQARRVPAASPGATSSVTWRPLSSAVGSCQASELQSA
jgi:hypothetical protein